MRIELRQATALGTATMAALYIGCMLVWRATDAHDPPDDAEVNVASDTLHLQDTENVYDLVQTVRTPDSPHVVRTVRRLGDLSVFKRFQTQIGDFGGIQALVDLLPIDCRNMDSDSKDLTVAILVALNNLSVHGTNHSLMHAAHVEFLVAEVYEQPSLDLSVRLSCLRLLCNLAMWAESSQTLLALPVIHTLAADLLTSSSADWSDKILQLFVNLTDPASLASVVLTQHAAVESIVDATISFCEVEGDHVTSRQHDNAQLIVRNVTLITSSVQPVQS